MKTVFRCGKTIAVVYLLALGGLVARADCYRYISGADGQPVINDSCVEELNVTPIFVRRTETGYDLLIPSSTEEPTEMRYKRAASAGEWLSTGTNLANTQAVVDAMVLDTDFVLPLGTSRIEQMNYTLASWFNTSGATSSIATLVAGSNPGPLRPCQMIGVCDSCEDYWCVPGPPYPRFCTCSYYGTDCCVIGKEIAPNDDPPL